MPLFNRPHPKDPVLAEIDASYAVLSNARYDENVTKARAGVFESYLENADELNSMNRSIKRYHEDRVRARDPGDFEHEDLNGRNFVPLATGDSVGMHRGIDLVHILDLSGLGTVFEYAKQTEIAGFEEAGLFSGYEDWLRANLDGKTGEAAEPVVERLLRAMAAQKPRFKPIWVGLWDEFKDWVDFPAERWLQLYGLVRTASREHPRYLIPLRFQAGQAQRLAVPTVLDAGRHLYFHPAPPESDSGFTVDVVDSSNAPKGPPLKRLTVARPPSYSR